jgi:hypothetical protein
MRDPSTVDLDFQPTLRWHCNGQGWRKSPPPLQKEGLRPSQTVRARLECCFDLLLRRAMLALTQHNRLGHGVSESTALINLNV